MQLILYYILFKLNNIAYGIHQQLKSQTHIRQQAWNNNKNILNRESEFFFCT